MWAQEILAFSWDSWTYKMWLVCSSYFTACFLLVYIPVLPVGDSVAEPHRRQPEIKNHGQEIQEKIEVQHTSAPTNRPGWSLMGAWVISSVPNGFAHSWWELRAIVMSKDGNSPRTQSWWLHHYQERRKQLKAKPWFTFLQLPTQIKPADIQSQSRSVTVGVHSSSLFPCFWTSDLWKGHVNHPWHQHKTLQEAT